MRTDGRWSIAAIVSAAFLNAGPALGQGAAAAEALFNQAREAMQRQDYEIACARFRESDRLDPAVGTRFNLANCEELRGKLAMAWQLYRAVIEQLPADDERLTVAQQRAQALEQKLPRLTLRLAADAPANTTVRGAELTLSGAAFGVPLPIDPGRHEFSIEAPGHRPKIMVVDIRAGQALELEARPGAPEPPAAGPPAGASEPAARTQDSAQDAASPGSSRRTLGFVFGGIGVAGVLTGSVAGVMALGKKSTADEHCSDALRVCDTVGREANDSGRQLAMISTAGFVVGGLGLAAGAYFILTSPDSKRPAVAAELDPMSFRLSVRGAF